MAIASCSDHEGRVGNTIHVLTETGGHEARVDCLVFPVFPLGTLVTLIMAVTSFMPERGEGK